MIGATLLVGLASILPLAGHDDNVEWAGISHISWLDRAPLCPVDGETFLVRVQTYRYDLTSVRVRVDDGTATWIDASWSHANGPYDIWVAQIPATAADSLSYYFELTDGAETDYLGESGMASIEPIGEGWLIDYVTLSHAPVGSTLTSDGGAAFKVWGPGATSAAVRGAFNGWGETALTGDGNYWWGYAPDVSHGDNYKFYFSDSHWSKDARFRYYNPNDNDNSMVFNPTLYRWGDDDFTTPAFEDMIIYELHIGTFSGRNDGLGDRMGLYRDVVNAHLDHLLYLGVNVVELMPITEFNGYNSWGYNPTNPWGVEESYGDPNHLKYLVDKLHQNGIAVIMDVVYNHFSNDGNFLYCYDGTQHYFDGDCDGGHVDTPWGSQADFDRWEVQDYIADNAIFWMDEYHIDGFRMDATRYMRDNWIFPDGQSSGWGLMQRFNDQIDNRAVHKISIAEELPNDTAITNPTSIGGAGFDSQWHDAFGDNVRGELVSIRYGGDPSMAAIRDAINDYSYSNKTKLVRYVESHDEAGNEQRLPYTFDSDPTSVYAIGRSKLAQGLTMMTPGIPMFLQGGEWFEESMFNSQYADRLDWSKATSRSAYTLFFHDLISVRRSNCAMRSNAGFNVHHVDDSNNVIAFHRWDLSGNRLLVVANFSNSDRYNYRIGFPAGGTWHEILNSQASVYSGNGIGNGGSISTEWVSYDGMSDSAQIVVPQMGLLVFRYDDAPGRSADLSGDGHVDLYDYALMQTNAGGCGCGLSADLNEDGRVNTDDLAELVNSLTGPR